MNLSSINYIQICYLINDNLITWLSRNNHSVINIYGYLIFFVINHLVSRKKKKIVFIYKMFFKSKRKWLLLEVYKLLWVNFLAADTRFIVSSLDWFQLNANISNWIAARQSLLVGLLEWTRGVQRADNETCIDG